MMTRDQMIEKAAIAIYERLHGEATWDAGSVYTRSAYLKEAATALTAVIPGIMAGTHWEAPIFETGTESE